MEATITLDNEKFGLAPPFGSEVRPSSQPWDAPFQQLRYEFGPKIQIKTLFSGEPMKPCQSKVQNFRAPLPRFLSIKLWASSPQAASQNFGLDPFLVWVKFVVNSASIRMFSDHQQWRGKSKWEHDHASNKIGETQSWFTLLRANFECFFQVGGNFFSLSLKVSFG